MPRFFFDVDDGAQTFRDETGEDLPNDAAAKREAVSRLGARVVPNGSANAIAVTVLDERRDAIFRASIAMEDGWQT